MNDKVKSLESLREAYQKIREKKLASRVVIKTIIGDYQITNEQIVTTILDLLIHEANKRINQEVNR